MQKPKLPLFGSQKIYDHCTTMKEKKRGICPTVVLITSFDLLKCSFIIKLIFKQCTKRRFFYYKWLKCRFSCLSALRIFYFFFYNNLVNRVMFCVPVLFWSLVLRSFFFFPLCSRSSGKTPASRSLPCPWLFPAVFHCPSVEIVFVCFGPCWFVVCSVLLHFSHVSYPLVFVSFYLRCHSTPCRLNFSSLFVNKLFFKMHVVLLQFSYVMNGTFYTICGLLTVLFYVRQSFFFLLLPCSCNSFESLISGR